MQETQVWYLVWEDPTDQLNRATEPMRHNYWACTLQQEKSQQGEAGATREQPPTCHNRESPHSNEDPAQPKEIKKFFPCITHALNLAHLQRNHSVRVSALHGSPQFPKLMALNSYTGMGHHYQSDPSWGPADGSAMPHCPSEGRKWLSQHLSDKYCAWDGMGSGDTQMSPN